MSDEKVEVGDVRLSEDGICFIVPGGYNNCTNSEDRLILWFTLDGVGPIIRDWPKVRIENSKYVCNISKALDKIESDILKEHLVI